LISGLCCFFERHLLHFPLLDEKLDGFKEYALFIKSLNRYRKKLLSAHDVAGDYAE